MACTSGGKLEGAAVSDQLPVGMRVLVVDDGVVCLHVLKKMLWKCMYNDVMVKALAQHMADAKENIDSNLVQSNRSGNADSVIFLSKILSSCLEEQFRKKCPESYLMKDFPETDDAVAQWCRDVFVSKVARETNDELQGIQADPTEGFDVGSILNVSRSHLSSEWEATRIEALHWIATLLLRHRIEVLSYLNDIFETLLKSLSDPSDEHRIGN